MDLKQISVHNACNMISQNHKSSAIIKHTQNMDL